jgi:hypothetical protein
MSESLTARAIVLTGSSVSASDTASAAVVKAVASSVNSSDERVQKLTVLVDGEEKSLLTNADNVLVKDGKTLEAGDVIQYRTNAKGELVSFRLLLDVNGKNTEFAEKLTENMSVVYGSVTKKFSGSVNVSVNGAQAVNYKTDDSVNVYEVDTTGTKTVVSKASLNDISVFDEEDNNRIFLRLYKDNVAEVIIIK